MSRCVWVGLKSDVLKSIWSWCLKMSCLCNLSCSITWMSHICHFLIPLKREGPLRTYFSRYSTFGTYIKNQKFQRLINSAIMLIVGNGCQKSDSRMWKYFDSAQSQLGLLEMLYSIFVGNLNVRSISVRNFWFLM